MRFDRYFVLVSLVVLLLFLAAQFMPISFGNTFWSIVIDTPEDGVIGSLRGLRSKLLIATVALLMICAMCLYFIIRTRVVIREQRQRDADVAALRESEARYKSLFEANPAPTVIYERGEFGILAVNEAFVNRYGYSRQELSGMRLTDLFPDNQKKAFTDTASSLRGYRNVGEWNHRTRDGSLIHIIACSNDLVYEGREARIAVVTDVSERKHIEEALRESEEKFRLVFENAFDGLSIFEEAEDPKEGRLVDCNYRYAELAGRSREELLRIGTLRRFTRSLGEVEREYIRGGEAFRGTFAWNRPDGKQNVIEFTGVPFEMRGKQYAMGIDRDVTERKLAEERVRQSEEQFRLISENVADMIAVLDIDGKLLYSSPSYKCLLLDPLALRGTDAFTEIHPEDREKVRNAFNATVRTGVGRRSEFRFVIRDGTIRHIESQESPVMDESGKVAKIVVVSRDVTEQQRLEQQSLRAQRMESIGTLASGIAHDLNNVLAPIMMAIEIMRPKVSDPKGRKWLNTIETSAKRGAAIVKQVLAFGRGIGGEQISMKINHVVSEIVKITEETFPRSIEIREEVPGGLWSVMADPTQLHQVLLNICVNARDAMPHGGTLAISADNVTLDEEYARLNLDAKPGSYVAITIADAGTGIPADIRDRIFDPFFTTKELGKGTGLGLSTTLAIVKSHGGFIELSSELGKGTTFRVYMPAIVEGPAVAREEKPASLPEGDGELILIIDDEAAIREIMKEALEAYGYRTIDARDGVEGVALFEEHRKDIKAVVTDMMMPNMDGTKAIQAMQRIDPDVLIIAASGLAEAGRPMNASDLGVQAYLTKPYTAEKLLQTLQAILTKA